MNKIQVETYLGTKTFKVDDIVKVSPEGRKYTMLGHGFKLRIISIINEWRVLVEVLENNAFTNQLNYRNEKTGERAASAVVHYEKDEIKRFRFKISAEYLESVKTKSPASSIAGFGF